MMRGSTWAITILPELRARILSDDRDSSLARTPEPWRSSHRIRTDNENARPKPGVDWSRVLRIVAGAAFGLAVVRAILYLVALPDGSLGVDFNLYTDATRHWLATGQLYPERQMAPYVVMGAGEILYPPIMLYLFVPFTALPFVLWVGLPIALTIEAIRRMHPAPWALAVIGVASVTHAVQAPFFWGTPAIWLVPAVGWGLLLGWPAVLVAVKPMFLPLVLPAMRRRSFWLGAAVLVGLSLPFGGLWLDWLTSIRNAGLDPTYGWIQVVPLALPVVAWLG